MKKLSFIVLAVLLLAVIPIHVSAQSQYALDFDGSNDYVGHGDIASVEGISYITVEAWVKAGVEVDVHASIIRKENVWALTYGVTTAGKASFYVRESGGGWHNSGESTISIDDDNWHHVRGVYDNNIVYIFVDGGLENSATIGSITLSDNSNVVGVGALIGTGREMNGTIDEVRVSTVARSTSNFTAPTTEFSTDGDTELLLHMNTGSGQTATDSSGNGNHGQLGSDPGVDVNDPTWIERICSPLNWWTDVTCVPPIVDDAVLPESFAKGEIPSATDTMQTYSSASTTFTATNLTANITLSTQADILLLANLQVSGSVAASAWVRLLLDDTPYIDQERLVGTEPGNMLISDLAEDVAAGTHNVAVEARVSAGTLTLVNSSLVAVAMHDGYGEIPAAQGFVASDTTTSATLEDIDGLSFTLETYALSYIWSALCFSGDINLAVKEATFTVVIDDFVLEQHTHHWATADDKNALFVLGRTNVKLTPGLHTVKGQWYVSPGGTLTGENVSLVAFASESNLGDREFSIGKVVVDDTTESTTIVDMTGASLTAPVSDSAHVLAVMSYESEVNATDKSVFHGISLDGDAPPILERGIETAAEVSDAGVMRRTSTKATADTDVQVQWHVESSTLGTADDAVLTAIVLRSTKIDPEPGLAVALIAGIVLVFGAIAVVAMKKR